MVKANELRIGNWVDTTTAGLNDGIQVSGIYEDRICFDDGDMFDPKYVEPIPLTPEILEKCGFERLPNFNIINSMVIYLTRKRLLSFGCVGTPNEMLCIQEMEDDKNSKSLIVLHNYDYDGYMHLHQLQNLYFALTNEELKINLC